MCGHGRLCIWRSGLPGNRIPKDGWRYAECVKNRIGIVFPAGIYTAGGEVMKDAVLA